MNKKFRIGTCSWKYDSWKGIVYPENENINYLEEYSRHYDTVEIDQWFWSLFSSTKIALPQKSAVLEYKESVSKDFKFTIKVPNSITLTHFYNKNYIDRHAELKRVAELVNDLASRKIDVYLNINNHYEGSAPLTIERIKKYLA